MEKVLVYIDGNNFFRSHRDLGIRRIDLPALVARLVGPKRQLIRAYYYGAVPARDHDPLAHDRQMKFFEYIDFQERMEARVGTLKVEHHRVPTELLDRIRDTLAAPDANPDQARSLEELERELRKFLIDELTEIHEKGVDIQIAVDMMDHAQRGLADVQVLVSGDADFLPVVRHLKGQGKVVEIAGVPGNVAAGLRAEADLYVRLDRGILSALVPGR
ncbi:NYN domain-containing protein [bacterium]|nr:NYN domain-containing protein [bacterium]